MSRTRDEDRGLYRKFDIRRMDGSSRKGKKHHGCKYFILDLDHDPFAVPALRAYAEACRGQFPVLAADLLLIAGNRDPAAPEGKPTHGCGAPLDQVHTKSCRWCNESRV